MAKRYEYIIIGAGIVGLTLALTIKKKYPASTILIIDKEDDIARHASGRNSGVLHAGFYYSADSLKAKLTVRGNALMKEYCRQKGLTINECGKLVVAQDENELPTLYELEKRGRRNGSNIRLIDEAAARELEPNLKTHRYALHSPDTSSVDPVEVCQSIKKDLLELAVDFSFLTTYHTHKRDTIVTSKGEFEFRRLINSAGLYADKVAQDFGCGKNFTLIPFKGIYLKYTKNKTDIRTNIYPVPNLKNPFLGVHFTKTVHGDIKIGPTAIPAFWRENYVGWDNFKLQELLQVVGYESRLFLQNAFNFRSLAFEEMKKYNSAYFIGLAEKMVQHIDPAGFTQYTKPGIRAQLLDKRTLQLVQDFAIERTENSIHILNAVSPAFTCAFPFSELVVNTYL